MKRSILFVSLSAAAIGLIGGAATVANSAGQGVALVRLQPGFPGTAQTGNINVNGVLRAGFISMDGSLNFYGQSISNSILAFSSGANTPSIVGSASANTNAGVWGRNTTTGAEGFLAYGNSAVYGDAGGGANWAGNFQGSVFIRDALGVGTSTPAVPLEVVGYAFFSGAAPHSVSINNSATQVLEIGIAGGNGQFSTSAVLNDGILRNMSGGAIHLQAGSGVAGMTISGTNRVGIGTNAPVAKLNVVETSTSISTSAARIYGDNQGAASIGNGFWAGGLEAVGANGLIGATNRPGGYGVSGVSVDSVAIYGFATGATAFNYGVLGTTLSGNNGYGVFSSGRTGASGTKSFRIDHPQDPLNKYLLHYSSEGPEPLNIYRGTITTDEKGEAWVQLPSYYEDINKDPSYQLTVVDDTAGPGFVQVKVAKKINGNRFMIMTSAPKIEVCWEVKALRNDAFVQKYGAAVEVNKTGREKGKYQHPELYGAPKEMGMNYSQSPTRDNANDHR